MRRTIRPELGLLIAAAILIVVGQLNPRHWLRYDPFEYRLLMAGLFDGTFPYIEASFEHLPGAIVPMAAAWLLGGFSNTAFYRAVYAGLMTALLLATMWLLGDLGRRLAVPRVRERWMWQATALLPLLLYRHEPWIAFLTVLALRGLVAGEEARGQAAGLAAILSKGWPAVLAPVQWWRGRRGAAASMGLVTVALGGLLLTPGFREGRSFDGVQVETLAGGLAGLARTMSGAEPGVFGAAGSIYVEVPFALIALQVTVAAVLLAVTLSALRRPFSWERALSFLAAAVGVLLIASPLLSAQFVFWLAPFIVLVESARLRLAMVVTSVLTLLTWSIGGFGVAFFLSLTLRNLLIVAMTAVLATTGLRRTAPEPAMTTAT